MARSLSRCALSAAVCIATLSRIVHAQETTAPPAAEAPPSSVVAIEAKIEAALGEVTSLQFTHAPLSDVATFIKERHRLQIQFDTAALDTAGITLDTPVDIDVEGVTLRSGLNLMLRSIESTYEIRDGVLLITTPEEVDNHLVTKVYDARRFLYTEDDLGRRVRNADSVIELITAHVQPSGWTDVGGTGAIQEIDRSLVMSLPWGMQEEVGQFLRALEKALEQHRQGSFHATVYVGPDDTSATQAVRRALAEPTSLQFKESPLADIVTFIKERHNLQVQLDTAALDTAGVTSDTPVTIDVEELPLANALTLMLKSIELTYLVADEVLLITTPEEVDSRLSIRIYPVKDLYEAEQRAAKVPQPDAQIAPLLAKIAPGRVGSPYGPGGYGPSVRDREQAARQDEAPPAAGGVPGPNLQNQGGAFCKHSDDALINLVTSTIEPTTWTDVGGTGGISYVPEFQGLVISQTDDVHAQIEALFAQLRRVALMQQATDDAEPTTDKSGELSLRAYYLTLGDGQRIKDVRAAATLIERVIESGTWNARDGRSFIHVVDDALMIQTTKGAHERIDALLKQLQITNGGGGRAGGSGLGGGQAADASGKEPAKDAK